MMGFLDKLLGRSKAVAGEVTDKGKELAGDARDQTEGTTGPEHGEPESGAQGSHDDATPESPSGSAT
jgi:hypothetical protein